MKKRIALAMALVIACLTMLLAGCGNKGGNPMEGTWEVSKVSMSGIELSGETLEQFGGALPALEFKADGQVAITGLDSSTDSAEATYKVDGNKVEITAEGETLTATLDGNNLTMEEDGASLTFTKK